MIKGPINGSPDWLEYRCGLVTASRFGDILTPPKTKEAQKAGLMSATAEGYLMEVVSSTFTRKGNVGGKSAAMIRGNDMEMEAGLAYERHRRKDFVDVIQGHIWRKSEDSLIAASLDFEVEGDDEGPGIVECKCPDSKTHLGYWLQFWEREEAGLPQLPPDDYLEQIQGQLWVAERAWCDFVSYDDRMPEPLRLLTFRVYRDDEVIARLATEVPKFAGLVAGRVARVRERIAMLGPVEGDRLIHNLLETSDEE